MRDMRDPRETRPRNLRSYSLLGLRDLRHLERVPTLSPESRARVLAFKLGSAALTPSFPNRSLRSLRSLNTSIEAGLEARDLGETLVKVSHA